MKTGLLLKQGGEIDEIKFRISKPKFSMEMFKEYTNYKIYENYIVLYNNIVSMNVNVNVNVLPFTNDRFNGDILLIRLTASGDINNFTLDSYIKIISKIKEEDNDMYYSSDEMSDIEDTPLFSF